MLLIEQQLALIMVVRLNALLAILFLFIFCKFFDSLRHLLGSNRTSKKSLIINIFFESNELARLIASYIGIFSCDQKH